jgi:hypothetical protein
VKRHYPFGEFINPLAGCTGKLPSATNIGMRTSQLWENLAYYRQSANVFAYSGPPEGSINGLGSDNEYHADFYVVTFSPQTYADKKRYLTGIIQPWQIDVAAGNPIVKWYPNYSSGTNYTLWDSYAGPSTYKSVYSDKSFAPLIGLASDNFSYSPASGNSFVCGKLHMDYLQVAGIGLSHVPVKPSEMYDANTAIDPVNFAENQHIVGFAIRGGDFTDKSLGALIYRVGPSSFAESGHADTLDDGENYNASVVTSRALVSWGHPVGVFLLGGPGATDVFGNFRFRFRTRDIYQPSGSLRYVRGHYAVVASGGAAGTEITLTVTRADTTSDTVTHTLSGALASPTMLTGGASGNLDLQPGALHEMRVQVTTGADAYIHTVALFEGVRDG